MASNHLMSIKGCLVYGDWAMSSNRVTYITSIFSLINKLKQSNGGIEYIGGKLSVTLSSYI